jgi:hypothetical protein
MFRIETLNRTLGECLGYVGRRPRFSWQWAPDIVYFWRPITGTDFQIRSWGERVGKRWLLCQWVPPEQTRQEWAQIYKGTRPYPGEGQWRPHPESALEVGQLPDEQITTFYIWSLQGQMERAEMAPQQVLEQCEAEAQKEQDANEAEFRESVESWRPLSWTKDGAWEPGTRGGPVSFGGI